MPSSPNATEYGHVNVGAVPISDHRATEYGHVNVGRDESMGDHGAYEYGHYGDVVDGTPNPRVWHVEPTSGRPNTGFVVYGYGMGNAQATYDGQVIADRSAEGLGDQALGVISWTQVGANKAAFSKHRLISSIPVPDRVGLYFTDEFTINQVIGEPWESTFEAWIANGGEAAPPVGAGRRFLLFDALADGTLTWVLGTADARAVFRFVDEDNYLWFEPVNQRIRQRVAGVDTTPATFGGNGTVGDSYSVELDGSSITVRRNGVLVGSTSLTTHQSATKHGLVAFADVDRWRSFTWDSGLDPATLIDTEHQQIGVTAPGDAAPPGFSVRVETDGP